MHSVFNIIIASSRLVLNVVWTSTFFRISSFCPTEQQKSWKFDYYFWVNCSFKSHPTFFCWMFCFTQTCITVRYKNGQQMAFEVSFPPKKLSRATNYRHILDAQWLHHHHHHHRLKACSQCCLDLNVLQNIFVSQRTTKTTQVWIIIRWTFYIFS